MRLARDGWHVQDEIEQGNRPPQWYLDEPRLLPHHQFYLNAFWRLSRDRVPMSNGVAAIPWTSMERYASRYGLHGRSAELFFSAIEAMDASYMKKRSAELRKQIEREEARARRWSGIQRRAK